MAPATLTKLEDTVIDGCCSPVAVPTVTDAEAEEYAGWFRALSDPTRVRILNLLARNEGPLCVCDIVDQFDLGQPTISHHLKILKDTCFVHAERRGTFMFYQINPNCIAGFPEAARRIMGH